ncbi:MAG: phage major capsid protein [Phormidium tanganyikae FI6-MK23]|jgi:hypothetical protein|nr:phage major capsid protein [Phormidium tanganyikae FI6-MK23]
MPELIFSTETLAPLDLLRSEIQSGIAETKIKEYPLLNRVQKRDAYQTAIHWPVSVGTGNTYGRATSETPNQNSTTDTNLQASLPIGSRVLEHKFSIDLTQATQALRIAPQALRNLYRGKLEAGMDALMKQLETLLYTGDGSNASHGIVGLNRAMSNAVTGPPATNRYAEIDGVAFPGWTSHNETAGANRALTTDLLRAATTGQGKLGGNFDYVLTTFDLADAMEKIFETRLAVNRMGGSFDLSFTGLTYKDREVHKSIYTPDRSIYFLNTSDLYLHTYALAPALSTMPGGDSQVVNAQGLNILLTRMPQTNPHAIDMILSVQAQFQLQNRKSACALLRVQ